MAARDRIHRTVRRALLKDDWNITHEPYILDFLGEKLIADLGAGHWLAAQKHDSFIVVEIKSFIGQSFMRDFEAALGQYLVYRTVLRQIDPDRKLYMAISGDAYDEMLGREIAQLVLKEYPIAFVVIELSSEGGYPMDFLTKYRQIIKRVLLDYLALVERGSPKSEVEDIRLFDDETNCYMLYRVGWHKNRRVHDTTILVRILADKVWLEVDWTDEVIAQQLIEAGIPAQDMRYGFHHPLLRDEPAAAVA